MSGAVTEARKQHVCPYHLQTGVREGTPCLHVSPRVSGSPSLPIKVPLLSWKGVTVSLSHNEKQLFPGSFQWHGITNSKGKTEAPLGGVALRSRLHWMRVRRPAPERAGSFNTYFASFCLKLSLQKRMWSHVCDLTKSVTDQDCAFNLKILNSKVLGEEEWLKWHHSVLVWEAFRCHRVYLIGWVKNNNNTN